MLSIYRKKRLFVVSFIYWFLLLYLIAALTWWFIELWQQNQAMYAFRTAALDPSAADYGSLLAKLQVEHKRNESQYIGEGLAFLLVTLAGAVFVYRAVRRQIQMNAQQRNFMMAVTHELKTPIAITRLNLETLKKHKLESDKQAKLINSSLQETTRLNDLCNNILLSSEIESGHFSPAREDLDLTRQLESIISEYRQRFPELSLFVDLAPEIQLRGDALLIRLAITNLIDNAMKYSPHMSPIGIKLEEADGIVRLQVSDQGQGIPEVERTRIFEKFYRIGHEDTRQAKGTGLGLYLTKKIVEDHDGSIRVSANHPRGSIFTLEFPE